MANIMINEICNQRCPYCFAAEFVNKNPNNMSFANFKKAVKFACTSQVVNKLGIIGGEPLLHPEVDTFVKYAAKIRKVKRVIVFTNGVHLLEHPEILQNKKVAFLVNVNSPEDVGESNFQKTVQTIDYFYKNKMLNRLTIGLNIYSKTLDYSFFINLADKYNFPRVRLSIVVPAYGAKKNGYQHFEDLKETTLKIVKKLYVNGISFHFDCNVPPICLWDDVSDDLKLMGLIGTGSDLLPLNNSVCAPVIDILPDLTAIRCFGLSDKTKVQIKNFKTINSLKEYYIREFDNNISCVPQDKKCNDCPLFPKRCFGGCLANRKDEQ